MNCEQPGCSGQIVDGYCDVCGLAPAAAIAPEKPEPATPAGEAPRGPSTPTMTSVASGSRPGTTRTRSASRGGLGAGLVDIPRIAFRDPSEALMADPTVPESRRFCSSCDEQVGRSRDGQPGRPAGFCRKCGAPFSFEPKLRPGEVVAGQYEVAGCLAHGGMGWVYLARDQNVSGRWVVLKGLLNTGDRDATAAALAERRFLAEVEHPNIVKIFNFVPHESSGYIVMEYVGGQSLKQIMAARREANGGEPNPLPLPTAIAYMLEILPALGYLHEEGLVFCDFKLDNVIQTQHSLKLIDLGGVYRLDESANAVFGTVGYQAPEIATAGPSPASDLFTVARTLAVMCIDFRGYQTTYRHTLPPQDDVPLFQRYDSVYRLLFKATARDPEDRFQLADEMAAELYGVLREVVADVEEHPVPAPSTLFTEPLRAMTERPDWRVLPRPQVSGEDESAGYLAAITATTPEQMIIQLRAIPEQTLEVELQLAAAMIDGGEFDEAGALMAAIATRDPREWRVSWYRGLAGLARAAAGPAHQSFTTVYHALPGELAPKLALGLAAEAGGDLPEAAGWYEIVSKTDTSVTSAAFGLARCRLGLGDRSGAIAAYERVPDTSSGYIDAQIARISCLNKHNGAGDPTLSELAAAGSILETLGVEGDRRDRLTAGLLETALRLTMEGQARDDGQTRLLGRRVEERELRLGLEHAYRAMARRAPSRAERIRLVDEANRTRPRTWT
jgi:serine/threonine-protein kinase PknG